MDAKTPGRTSLIHRENKYLLLLSALLLLMLLHPIARQLGLPGHKHVLPILTVLVLVAGVHAVCQSRPLLLLGTGLWIVAAGLKVTAMALGPEPVGALHQSGVVVTLAAIILLTVLILTDVFSAGLGMTRDRLRGAGCAYLLMGLAWSFLYAILEVASPGAFLAGGSMLDMAKDEGSHGLWLLLYYSFVTMTTLGYGDMMPVSPIAQALAFLQAAVGQFYLTILVAYLVGLRLAAWMKEASTKASG